MIALSDIERWLGLDAPTTNDRLVLTQLEARAVAFIERETDRHFGTSTTFIETLPGNGSNTLWLKEDPTSITQVRDRTGIGETWTVLAAGDDDGWELRGFKLLRKKGYVWKYSEEYEVTYDFGYAAGSEPGEIRQLVFDLVKLKWDARNVEIGRESEQVGPHRITYARGEFTPATTDIPWVKETLAVWRHPRAA